MERLYFGLIQHFSDFFMFYTFSLNPADFQLETNKQALGDTKKEANAENLLHLLLHRFNC